MNRWAFYHGWAMGPWFFLPLSKALGGKPWFFDRGYHHCPSRLLPPHGKWNVITHSLGLWQVPCELLANTQTLIILGGFQHFLPQTTGLHDAVKRNIAFLRRHLSSQPALALHRFFSLCHFPPDMQVPADENHNFRLLEEDLDWLSVGSWTCPSRPQQTLIIQGELDQVVFPDQTAELAEYLDAKIHWFPGAGHGLPFSHPKAVANIIQQSITL